MAPSSMMKVILYQPQIPQNTGNIVRTCSVTGSGLVLVGPLGFKISDKWLKRAGLDYWEGVQMELIDDLPDYLSKTSHPFTFFSSKAKKIYTEQSYSKDHLLIFGSETSGLPEEFFAKWPDHFVKLPMVPNARCLNLATSVGVGVYEVLRQTNS